MTNNNHKRPKTVGAAAVVLQRFVRCLDRDNILMVVTMALIPVVWVPAYWMMQDRLKWAKNAEQWSQQCQSLQLQCLSWSNAASFYAEQLRARGANQGQPDNRLNPSNCVTAPATESGHNLNRADAPETPCYRKSYAKTPNDPKLSHAGRKPGNSAQPKEQNAKS